MRLEIGNVPLLRQPEVTNLQSLISNLPSPWDQRTPLLTHHTLR